MEARCPRCGELHLGPRCGAGTGPAAALALPAEPPRRVRPRGRELHAIPLGPRPAGSLLPDLAVSAAVLSAPLLWVTLVPGVGPYLVGLGWLGVGAAGVLAARPRRRLEIGPGWLRVTRGRLLPALELDVAPGEFESAHAQEAPGQGAGVLVVHRGGWRSVLPLASGDPAEARAVCAAINRLMREPAPPDPWAGLCLAESDGVLRVGWGGLRRTTLTLDAEALQVRRRLGPALALDVDDLLDLRPGPGDRLVAVLRRGREAALGGPLPRPGQAERLAALLAERLRLRR